MMNDSATLKRDIGNQSCCPLADVDRVDLNITAVIRQAPLAVESIKQEQTYQSIKVECSDSVNEELFANANSATSKTEMIGDPSSCRPSDVDVDGLNITAVDIKQEPFALDSIKQEHKYQPIKVECSVSVKEELYADTNSASNHESEDSRMMDLQSSTSRVLRPRDKQFRSKSLQFLEHSDDSDYEPFDDSEVDEDYIIPSAVSPLFMESDEESDNELLAGTLLSGDEELGSPLDVIMDPSSVEMPYYTDSVLVEVPTPLLPIQDMTTSSASSLLPSSSLHSASEMPVIYAGKGDCFFWNSVEPPMARRTPSHNIIRGPYGIQPPARSLGPLPKSESIWNLLIDNTMIEEIVKWTNVKIRFVKARLNDPSCLSSYRDTDAIEVRAFIGLLMLTCIFKSPHEDMLALFSTDSSGRQVFRATMSMKRFELLLVCLRFDNPQDRDQRKLAGDKAAAISRLFQKFINNSQSLYIPGDTVSIDEMLIPFRGRCPFRMYMPMKPAKYGIKIMAMTDSNSYYLYNAYIYTGKDSDGIGLSQEELLLSKTSQSVLRLTKPIKNTNRNITADNWFTSIPLVKELQKRNLTYVGTMKKNKREIPVEFMPSKQKAVHSSMYGFCDNITLLSYVPKKGRCVIMVSSMHHSKEQNDVTKMPAIIEFYNSTKSDVDVLDMKCANYSSNRHTRRWPMELFSTIVNISIANAFIIYNCFPNNQPLKGFNFTKELAYSLLIPHVRRRLKVIPNMRPELKNIVMLTLGEYPRVNSLGSDSPEISDRLAKRTTCRLCPYKKKRKTAYKCITCEGAICLKCSKKVCNNCVKHMK